VTPPSRDPALSAPPPPGDRNTAGGFAALGYGLGALGGAGFLLTHPNGVASPIWAAACIAIATFLTVLCVIAPWERLAQPWVLAPILAGIALAAASARISGGETSVLVVYFVFLGVLAGYFCTRAQMLGVVAAIAVACAPPLLEQHVVWSIDALSRWLFLVAIAGSVAAFLQRERDRDRRTVAAANTFALRDATTGVANRHGFEQRAASELARGRRHGLTFTILHVVLDGFERIDEAHGRAAGDEVLRRIALGAAGALRGEDVLARIGESEFAVLLPGANAAEATRVSARMVAAVERAAPIGERALALGARVGWATYPRDGSTLDELTAVAADMATPRRPRSPVSLALAGQAPAALPAEAPGAGDEPQWNLGLAAAQLALGALVVIGAWFAGPLVLPDAPARMAIHFLVPALLLIELLRTTRHAAGRERIGWGLIVVGSLLGTLPSASFLAAACIGGGLLVIADGGWFRDRYLMVDGVGVLVAVITFALAYVLPQVYQDGRGPDGIGGSLIVPTTVVALTCGLMVAYRTTFHARPDAWLVAFGYVLASVGALPFILGSNGLLGTTSDWQVAFPLAALIGTVGVNLRRSRPERTLAGVPEGEGEGGIQRILIGNLLLGALFVAIGVLHDGIPSKFVPFLTVGLVLRHLRARLIERDNAQLVALAQQQQAELAVQYRASLVALGAALEARDGYTGKHGEETVALATLVAERIGLSPAEIVEIETVAMLHDVGKIGTPNDILLKPGPLTEEEWIVMREHPVVGQRILNTVPGLERVARAVRHEHERWDGSGYPDGLAGEAIPLASRIVLVCDAFHAMTSDRSYRASMPLSDAVEELKHGAGTQFDPAVVTGLLAVIEDGLHEREAIAPQAVHHAVS